MKDERALPEPPDDAADDTLPTTEKALRVWYWTCMGVLIAWTVYDRLSTDSSLLQLKIRQIQMKRDRERLFRKLRDQTHFEAYLITKGVQGLARYEPTPSEYEAARKARDREIRDIRFGRKK